PEDARRDQPGADPLRSRTCMVGHAAGSGLAPAQSRRQSGDPRRSWSTRAVLDAAVALGRCAGAELFEPGLLGWSHLGAEQLQCAPGVLRGVLPPSEGGV